MRPIKSKVTTVNGWTLLAHPLFLNQLESLTLEVENLKQKDPASYQRKNPSKRLAAILYLIFEKIPEDPSLPEYRQGSALGHEHRHWFRAKFFQKYRLFFRYHRESKIIVYVWVNDEQTKRAYEKDSDAYAVFKKMLSRGTPPDSWESLLSEAEKAIARFNDYENAPQP
jgi:toxin YhaV